MIKVGKVELVRWRQQCWRVLISEGDKGAEILRLTDVPASGDVELSCFSSSYAEGTTASTQASSSHTSYET